jgi:hypothetical protein
MGTCCEKLLKIEESRKKDIDVFSLLSNRDIVIKKKN